MRRHGWEMPSTQHPIGAEMIASAQAKHRERLSAVHSTVGSTRSPTEGREFSHLIQRQKQAQMAFENAAEIERQNLMLLQKFSAITTHKQVDDTLSFPPATPTAAASAAFASSASSTPHPSPPAALAPRSLNRGQRARELSEISRQNAAIQARLEAAKHVVASASALHRQHQELEGVIARHCDYPRQNPLRFQDSYFVDAANPYKNWSGRSRAVSAPAATTAAIAAAESRLATVKAITSGGQSVCWEEKSDEGAPAAAPAVPMRPTRPASAAPSLMGAPRSTRPVSARHPHPPSHAPSHSASSVPYATLLAQEPLLLRRRIDRPVSARFSPCLKTAAAATAAAVAAKDTKKKSALVLSSHPPPRHSQAALRAAYSAGRPASPPSVASHFAPSPPPPSFVDSAAAATTSFVPTPFVAALRSPVYASPPFAFPLLLFSGPMLISDRPVSLHVFELPLPNWRVEILVCDLDDQQNAFASAESNANATSMQYSISLPMEQLRPFFLHTPDAFTDPLKTHIVSTIKEALRFSPMSDSTFELQIDLVRNDVPPMVEMAPMRPPSATRSRLEAARLQAVAVAEEGAEEEEEEEDNEHIEATSSAAVPEDSDVGSQPSLAQKEDVESGPVDGPPTVAAIIDALPVGEEQVIVDSPNSTHNAIADTSATVVSTARLQPTPPPPSLPSPTTVAPSPPSELFIIPTHSRNRVSLRFAPAAAAAVIAASPPSSSLAPLAEDSSIHTGSSDTPPLSAGASPVLPLQTHEQAEPVSEPHEKPERAVDEALVRVAAAKSLPPSLPSSAASSPPLIAHSPSASSPPLDSLAALSADSAAAVSLLDPVAPAADLPLSPPLPAITTTAAPESSNVVSERNDNGAEEEAEEEEEDVDDVMAEIGRLDATEDTTVFASSRPTSRAGGGFAPMSASAAAAVAATAAARPSSRSNSRLQGRDSGGEGDGDHANTPSEDSSTIAAGSGDNLPLLRNSASRSRFRAVAEEETNSEENDDGLNELEDVDWIKSPRATVALNTVA